MTDKALEAAPGEAEVVGLVKRLRTVSDMINMGEKIRWGEETSLMDQAADALQAMQARAEAAEARVKVLEEALGRIVSTAKRVDLHKNGALWDLVSPHEIDTARTALKGGSNG